jgi:membrane protein DedA with SNARE-associated domain
MDMVELLMHTLSQYALLAVAVGTFFEGEVALLVAGVAAWRGHLELPPVIMVAALATFVADFLHYYAGRRYGPALLRRFPSLHARSERVNHLMCRHHLPLIFSMRFLYGLRSAGLVVFGMTDVPMHRFLLLNFISTVVWAIAVTLAGYFFGGAIERVLTNVEPYQIWFAGVLLLLLSITWAWLRLRRMPAE